MTPTRAYIPVPFFPQSETHTDKQSRGEFNLLQQAEIPWVPDSDEDGVYGDREIMDSSSLG